MVIVQLYLSYCKGVPTATSFGPLSALLSRQRNSSASAPRAGTVSTHAYAKKLPRARRRVALATLYLGTGTQEATFLKVLADNLDKNSLDGAPQIQVLMDGTRSLRGASRGLATSCTALEPLLKHSVQSRTKASVHLFRDSSFARSSGMATGSLQWTRGTAAHEVLCVRWHTLDIRRQS